MIHDTDYEQGKRSAIFDIEINKEGVVEGLEISFTYIENKTSVKLYKDISQTKNQDFLDELKSKSILNKYTASINKEKFVLKLK
ncbi:MAG: hypothetical protein PHR25_01810 [Clostridia bacterium]|nr:hypothetical protein [Clostridia bacterium]MDD4375497.1 hypothetical protein [Clostridia bacterium]